MARGIRQGQWTSEALVEAHIGRITEINPLLNAVIFPMFEEARQLAKEADRKMKSGEAPGPLHGVPITVKESIEVAGTPSTWGLASRRGQRAQEDDPSVALLKDAGAIVLGKTNVMQLLMGSESVNPLYGRTCNPWRPGERSSGGSSGGEAAVIAAGGSPLGLGTDVGGSVRTPAHYCGIHALKPTPGRVPAKKPEGIAHVVPEAASMSSIGPMARHVEDLALAMQVISTAESLSRAPIRMNANGVKGLRIAFYTSDGMLAPSPAIQRAVRDAAGVLQRYGAEVREFALPDPEIALHSFYALLSAGGAEGIEKTVGTDEIAEQIAGIRRSFGMSAGKKRIGSLILRLLGQNLAGTHLIPYMGKKSAKELQRLISQREEYRQRFLRQLERQQIDALIGPPFPVPAIPHDLSLEMSFEGAYALLYNYLGLPAGVISTTAVRPEEEAGAAGVVGKDRMAQAAAKANVRSAGLPVGVQVAGRPWREDLVLTVMECLERESSAAQDYPVGKPVRRLPAGYTIDE